VHRWERRLTADGKRVVTVDLRERSDLARKYGVVIVPTVLRVAGDGTVLERLAPGAPGLSPRPVGRWDGTVATDRDITIRGTARGVDPTVTPRSSD
jgi:hypothetical protein